jgi:ATP-dependent metalloprotease
VIVIGATNLVESMDPAVKRPGRFDKIINISLPDVKGREEILKHYLGKVKISEGNRFDSIADHSRCEIRTFGSKNYRIFRCSA